MKKTSTVRTIGNKIFKGHKLTIGVEPDGNVWVSYNSPTIATLRNEDAA
jgi:hypothetical protein